PHLQCEIHCVVLHVRKLLFVRLPFVVLFCGVKLIKQIDLAAITVKDNSVYNKCSHITGVFAFIFLLIDVIFKLFKSCIGTIAYIYCTYQPEPA
ncbi:MAG TPA: hypothetical protein VM368_07940, partial [Flavisolibacter sp.]|nr:hypothetical protein [Flavisolibacter sp.]